MLGGRGYQIGNATTACIGFRHIKIPAIILGQLHWAPFWDPSITTSIKVVSSLCKFIPAFIMTLFQNPIPLPHVPDDLTIPQFMLREQRPAILTRPRNVPWFIDDKTGRSYTFEEVTIHVSRIPSARVEPSKLGPPPHIRASQWLAHQMGCWYVMQGLKHETLQLTSTHRSRWRWCVPAVLFGVFISNWVAQYVCIAPTILVGPFQTSHHLRCADTTYS